MKHRLKTNDIFILSQKREAADTEDFQTEWSCQAVKQATGINAKAAAAAEVGASVHTLCKQLGIGKGKCTGMFCMLGVRHCTEWEKLQIYDSL